MALTLITMKTNIKNQTFPSSVIVLARFVSKLSFDNDAELRLVLIGWLKNG